MKKRTKQLITTALVFSCSLLVAFTGLWAYSVYSSADESVSAASTDIVEVVPQVPSGEFAKSFASSLGTSSIGIPELPLFQEYDITLMMIGDDLLHPGIFRTGFLPDGTRNYDFLFEGISDFLAASDIKIINQETIFGGNDLEFSGYPSFNSPTEVGDAIADAGFNVVLHASNHAADRGLNGLLHCVDFWKTHPEVLMVGIYEDEDAASDIPILEIEGFTFAILNYTYGPNLASFPKNLEGHLNMLCDWNPADRMIDFNSVRPQVLEDIARAKELADVVIVCPHWGTEYRTKPTNYQLETAQQMIDAGADLIIGTHPHVPEPMEWITTPSGNRALCFYSLGNYVSTQKDGICILEAMAWVKFHVDKDGIRIDEDSVGVLPMVCQYNVNPLRFENVYLLENYTEELAASHGIRSWGGVRLTLADLQKWTDEIFGDNVLTIAEALGQ